ncbi:putative RxLR effector [Phytophthora palmivora]|uniref:RxLR effector protein n=1 Tax=Phytophthora palmivora TaxID=4796 RepID=A0A2P4X3I8_9STRA|nr:putative RxLR effector [Phytophthora palmivora]
MRSRFILLAVATSLLLYSDAALIAVAEDQNPIRRASGPGLVLDRITSNARFLRAREGTNDEDLNDEERATLDRVVSDLSENAVGAVKTLSRSKSLSASNPADDIPQLKKFLAGIEDENSKLFKHISEEMKVDKVAMRDMLNLQHKMKTMTMDEPANDKSFLLWMYFKRYIDQSR